MSDRYRYLSTHSLNYLHRLTDTCPNREKLTTHAPHFQPSVWTYPSTSRTGNLPSHPDPGVRTLPPHDLHALSESLATQTGAIIRPAYDPENWLSRAEILRRLRYPELALGDAHKATSLCRGFLRQQRRGTWRSGRGRGFWMLMMEKDGTGGPDDDGLLLELLEKARRAEERFVDAEGTGKFCPRQYPWLDAAKRGCRSDELVAQLNEEFEASALSALGCAPPVEVRRHACGDLGAASRDVLGVFATGDILKGTTALVDKTRIWGCNDPGRTGDLDNLHCGLGCGDPIHPNLPEEDSTLDLRWGA